MNDVETTMAAVRALEAIGMSVLHVSSGFSRDTRMGEYLRAVWQAINASLSPIDDHDSIEYTCTRLKRAERELLGALEVRDGR